MAVEAVLYEILGEKTYGIEFEYFSIRSIFGLPAKEKNSLLKLDQLIEWLNANKTVNFFINAKGLLEERN